MIALKFENFVRTVCVFLTLYIYIFFLADILRLNPNDDGDSAFMWIIFGFFPTLRIIASIIFNERKETSFIKVLTKVLTGLVIAVPCVVLINTGDGFLEAINVLAYPVLLLLRGCVLLAPLAVYFIYLKTRDRRVFAFMAIAICIVAVFLYPLKNYIVAGFTGDACLAKHLIMKGYNNDSLMEVQGDVVCVTVDRGDSSQTYAWEVLKDADAKTFENLGKDYARDKNSVFYRGRIIEAHSKTFEIDPLWKSDCDVNCTQRGTQYKKDDQFVCFHGEKVIVNDISQFQIIDLCDSYLCATDGVDIFKEGKILPNIHANTLVLFHSCQYAKDDRYVYYAGEVLDGADVKTFTLYGPNYFCYAHDTNGLYFKNTKISDDVPVKLEKVTPLDMMSPDSDGRNIYYYGKKLNLNRQTFEYLGHGVSKDAAVVYYRDKKIEGADAATFEIIPLENPMIVNVCAKDKNQRYFDGEVSEHPLCTE